jgi:tRNA-5-methyluridine54 2-sulfurtransferase
MHCRKCGQKAAINLFEHRLSLCKAHFLEWMQDRTEKTIKKYSLCNKNERLIVAVSGGKDSLALWDILWRLGYTTEGIHINLGIDGGVKYSETSQLFAKKFAGERGLALHIIDIQETINKDIHQLSVTSSRGKEKTCSICGLIKRHILNQFALDGGYDVLATAHNLDDEAATLMMNTLNWNQELLIRQSPSLPAQEGFTRKIKPFCRLYEREAAAYALLSGIDYVYEECPYSQGNPQLQVKQSLNQMELSQPGLKLQYYLTFLNAKQAGFFTRVKPEFAIECEHICSHCGQPTGNESKICSFCRLISNTTESSTKN